MNNDIKELMSGILKDMSALNYIKPGDVPNINLYMDQVTTFMYEHLHDTKRTTDDKVLTKTTPHLSPSHHLSYSSSSICFAILSRLSVGSNRATTIPRLLMRNFVKFHFMSAVSL